MSRKEKMKVYHGIPKSPTDGHTVFYASFDGSVTPEVYTGEVKQQLADFSISPTGYGIRGGKSSLAGVILPTTGCVEFWLNHSTYNNVLDIAGIRLYYNNVSNYITIQFRCYPTPTNIDVRITPKTTLNHIRIDYSNKDGNFSYSVYCNGMLQDSAIRSNWQLSLSTTPLNPQYLGIVFGANSDSQGCTFLISDLHISNINRGDYFPNLPQDFIEGKAIIKERLGQQQIKGDPLISQETSVVVPAYVGDKRKLYQLLSDKSGQLLDNPEITNIWGADSWSNGSYLKIKALNNEVISGVIDSDTALGRIISVTKISNKVAKVVCDDVSKIANGDMLNFCNPNNLGANSWASNNIYGVVSELNTSEKSFVVTCQNYDVVPSVGDVFLEITPSTSSPIVKSEDGTVVNGTWTGLGTNVATFTLGSNTGLTGKDLVVTYSLNMPQGNSHFPELPSDIERAYTETGIEMKPVNEIVIEDDFEGKIVKSEKECPHKTYVLWEPELKLPSQFIVINNDTQNIYSGISKLDSNSYICDTTTNGKRPQQLFIFNLVEMIERKLGCKIPSNDKSQWVKDNVISHTITHYGYGTCPSGNKLYLRVYHSDWSGSWEHSRANSEIPAVCTWTGTGNKVDGCIYVLAYTDATDGVTKSSVVTDYIKVSITLKGDSTYTTLYCDNKRAREDKCNPVLIQKETKTVKRYIPSKECFVTESKYVKFKGAENGTSYLTSQSTLCNSKGMFATTYGSGSYVDVNSRANKDLVNCINRLNPAEQPYLFNNEIIHQDTTSLSYPVFNRFINGIQGYNHFDDLGGAIIETSKIIANNYVAGKYKLVNVNGEMKLFVFVQPHINGKISLKDKYYVFPITNRPLIK